MTIPIAGLNAGGFNFEALNPTTGVKARSSIVSAVANTSDPSNTDLTLAAALPITTSDTYAAF